MSLLRLYAPANDNTKWEKYDETLEVIKKLSWDRPCDIWPFMMQFRSVHSDWHHKKHTNNINIRTTRELENMLWFFKFELSFKESENKPKEYPKPTLTVIERN